MNWIEKPDKQNVPIYFLLAKQISKIQSNIEVYSEIEEGTFQVHPLYYKPISLIIEKNKTSLNEEIIF